MSYQRLLAIRLYVSHGRDAALLRQLYSDIHRNTKLVDVFSDFAYNRSSLTMVAKDISSLVSSATSIISRACAILSMHNHSGSHPRLGTVDHISCHDLSSVHDGTSSVGDVSTDSIALAKALYNAVMRLPPQPYLYGAASEDGVRLAQLRRQFRYFEPNTVDGGWAGPASSDELQQEHGVCCIGAVKWVVNYNVKLTEVGFFIQASFVETFAIYHLCFLMRRVRILRKQMRSPAAFGVRTWWNPWRFPMVMAWKWP
eukprot:TRINITY_DN9900_c0_g1_i2.p1 TRINITY_DN9900_c0_g1~~TRINITY_DN9900_c0_g1_i2.p1  ORF type:complete len:256 (+),score=20.43 TRINITY_DN9900_c0_g1_i2:1141-1908(+)